MTEINASFFVSEIEIWLSDVEPSLAFVYSVVINGGLQGNDSSFSEETGIKILPLGFDV